MKKILMALLIAVTGTANAAWVAVWSEQNGGTIYYENATMQFSGAVAPGTGNPFIRATIHTNYQNAINNPLVCYPSAYDCQWKRLNVTVTYDWDCMNTVRVEAIDEQWDSGPTSESYDPGRPGYTIPEPRPLVPAPTVQAKKGDRFNIAGIPGLLAMQAEICRHWPRK
jgi:hypothetical protein